MESVSYKKLWDHLEVSKKRPTRCRKLIAVDYEEFANDVKKLDPIFMDNIVNSLFEGDFYILKSAYTKNFMENLKRNTFNYFIDKPSQFYKMLEGSPDFHRKIDLETGKKYSISGCKHSYYFYPWNEDPINIFDEIYQRWRVVKQLMGLDPKEYENNTPKDGIIDRVQVVRYPSRVGYLEPHSDPYKFQRLIHSGYMSKQGVDFEGLGFYLLGENDEVIETEHMIDVGDIGIGYATVYHGVAPVNTDKDPDWDNINDGRWFLSLYSNQSDEVKSRHTSTSVTSKLEVMEKDKKRIIPLGDI